jgi:hypothetical protein
MYLVWLLEICTSICLCQYWGTCEINIEFHFSAGAILVVRYGTVFIVCAYEITLYVAISLLVQKNIHI